ncbi:hypothetical protein MRX96_040001 [Rhipicephalus microplus]
MNTRDTLLTYHDITLHYCLSRLTFPPPHRSLSQHQQHLCRQLQARIFLTPARLALFHPGTYSPACRLWGSSITNFEHILYSCPAHLPLPLGTSEVRSRGRLLCPAADRTCNFGW